MEFLEKTIEGNVASVKLNRGKVNALNISVLDQLMSCFEAIKNDSGVNAVIITGSGKFFSFGFDIPEFLDYAKEDFRVFVDKFTSLYTYLFMYPKPLIAAINGHAIAGGCMLATACDYRIMAEGKAKISLNEIAFGSTVFAGSVEMLKFCAGPRNAETILKTGKMFDTSEAKNLGLIDRICSDEKLMSDAIDIATGYGDKSSGAFKSIKHLLRRPVEKIMVANEKDSIDEFLDIWYSEPVRSNLKKIKIY